MSEEKPGYARRYLIIVVAVVGIAAVGTGLACLGIGQGVYGLTLFLAIPFFLGFAPVATFGLGRAWSVWRCLAVGLAPCALAGLFLLLLGREGLVCLFMAVPLGLPLSALGALAAYAAFHRKARRGGMTATVLCFALTGGSLWVERRITPQSPVYLVEDTVEIGASTKTAWSGIVRMGALPPPRPWIFRCGVACPERTAIEGGYVGGTRRCTLSTGPLVERITAWEPNRRLAWSGISTPPPLREINPFRETDPPHLHGYYRSLAGEFLLEPLGPERTRVTRRSLYQHGLQPAWYWRWWCDYAAHQGHRYVLDMLANSVETHPSVVTRPIPGAISRHGPR